MRSPFVDLIVKVGFEVFLSCKVSGRSLRRHDSEPDLNKSQELLEASCSNDKTKGLPFSVDWAKSDRIIV